ncbi:hypothetical protein KJ903_01320 [Patescibacteria group bacterium]|nr:hypothetical protein [Patescibacteria group bacterium]
MFFYVYDKLVGSKKNTKKFGQMQTKLNELGILNDKAEISTTTTIENAVDGALSSGRHYNIIAVGDDATAHYTINAILKSNASSKKTVFGLIPFDPSYIAGTLGMSHDIEKACLAISRRKLEKIDIGYANEGTCFINSLNITCKRLGSSVGKLRNIFSRQKKRPTVTIKVRDFTVKTSAQRIAICNSPAGWEEILKKSGVSAGKVSPQDGFVDLITHNDTGEPAKEDTSFISAQKLEITSPDKITILADYTKKLQPPIKVGVGKQLLKVIVGKERNF